jgi:hypothetical protein
MTVTADSKKRVILPGCSPGEVFAFEDKGNGHFLLIRLTKPAPPGKKTRSEVRTAIEASRMRPAMGWDELKKLTRDL